MRTAGFNCEPTEKQPSHSAPRSCRNRFVDYDYSTVDVVDLSMVAVGLECVLSEADLAVIDAAFAPV